MLVGKPVEKVSQCIAVVESERTYRVSMGVGVGVGLRGRRSIPHSRAFHYSRYARASVSLLLAFRFLTLFGCLIDSL